MRRRGRDYSWLPDHHLGVVATLAHANELIHRAGEILFDYLRPGPIRLDNIADGPMAHVTVTGVDPLPAGAANYAAAALTQLRAAIEHTVYAEVEHQLGRPLSDREARAVEMPACTSKADFSTWLGHGRRRGLAPLQRGSRLVERIGDLQPYERVDHDNHPLRVLAEHTNLAKHRSPAVAATRLALVQPDVDHPEVRVAAAISSAEKYWPLHAGDILASGPRDVRVPLSIWPTVVIRRPHTGTWHVFMNELGDLEDWVRRIAVPKLAIGRCDVDELPPQLDTTVGHDDVRSALASAGTVPAAQRATRRIAAGGFRIGLVELLEEYTGRPDDGRLQAWADSLDDDAALTLQDQMAEVGHSVRALDALLRRLLAEAAAVDAGENPQPGPRRRGRDHQPATP